MTQLTTAQASPCRDYACTVVKNTPCGNHLYILTLKTEEPLTFLPGQFVMLDLPESRFMFRRPFSVLATNKNTFDIFYKVVGTGTQMMADFKEGLNINCLGPLGNYFSLPEANENILLIGGGIGIAPMVLFAKYLNTLGLNNNASCFYGVRSKEDVGLEDELNGLFGDNYFLSTDDDSAGFSGRVDALLKTKQELILNAQRAYICGPTPMMKGVSQLLAELNPALDIEVSLEEHMPCGTGACSGCVVFRNDQTLPSKVCVEGPVFKSDTLIWESNTAPLANTSTSVSVNDSSCEVSACQR